MFSHQLSRLTLAVSAVLVFVATESVHADPLNPLDFTSLGTLNLSGGSFTIDTDALTIVGDADPNTPLFTGVADDQNGAADFLNGVWVPGSMGIPEIAVFTFDDIDLPSSANITMTGTRALALLSHGNVMIDTTIDLSGESVPAPAVLGDPAPAGVGRAGGFSGGFAAYGLPAEDGEGPGGGSGASVVGNSGGFGGPGYRNSQPDGGPAYGDLVDGPLQGGSGGGSAESFALGGAAGGGALEISALGGVTLGASGNLIAAGGSTEAPSGTTFNIGGGAGSGGAIRIQGQSVDLLGSVDARAFWAAYFDTFQDSRGGGGRVAVFGLNQLFDFVVGQTSTASIDTSNINVEGGCSPFGNSCHALTRGLISISPQVTTIPSGQSLTLGQVTDLSDANRRLELVHRNIRVQQGGQAVVPAEGYVNAGHIELFAGGSTIAGPGVLDNRSELSGTGTIEAAVNNLPGGNIDAINDALTFTAVVTNSPGGQINAINSTLDFQADLTNNGELNLINSTILGSVVGGASGTASFVGDNSVSGNLTMASGDSLSIRLGGTAPGQFDSLAVGGDAALAGSLSVSLTGGFSLAPSLTFTIVDVGGSLTGGFNGLAEGGLVGNFGGTNLVITYAGGDGNDVALLSALPGDFDIDGDVDGTDFLKWQRGESPRPLTAADLADWEANHGADPGAISASSTAVPEPATWIALLWLMLAPLRLPRPAD